MAGAWGRHHQDLTRITAIGLDELQWRRGHQYLTLVYQLDPGAKRLLWLGEHRQVKIAPRSPWQNPYVERLIGTLRRECLDHMVVLNDAHLRRVLRAYLAYYHEARTHLALGKDAPEPRRVEPPDRGQIVATPMVGGLHHRYSRRAA